MTEVVPNSTLVKARKEGLELIAPINKEISLVIKTEADFQQADSLLTRIKQTKANWLGRMNPIIDPIRKGLDLLYSLRSDIVGPLDEAEVQVKAKMKAYRVEEARLLRAEEEAKQTEYLRLEAEARAKEKALESAKTKAMRDRIATARAEAQQKMAEMEAEAPAQPIRAAGSITKKTVKWEVTDMAQLVKYISLNPDLLSLIQVDTVQFNSYFKLEKPQPNKGWIPGIRVYEDLDIAGRKG